MRPFKDDTWTLTYRGFISEQETLREALCTLGNGYMGSRGAACESFASDVHYPGTYIAGVYNTLGTKLSGKTVDNEDLVNCPNWLPLTFRVEGETAWFCPSAVRRLSYEQQLDMCGGRLIRRMRVELAGGRRLRVQEQRVVHMGNPHLAGLRYEITAENFSGPVLIRSLVDGSVRNQNVARYRALRDRHWVLQRSLRRGMTTGLAMRTSQSRVTVAVAARLWCRGAVTVTRAACAREALGPARPAVYIRVPVRRNRTCVVEKIISIHTSRDGQAKDPWRRALADVARAPGFVRMADSHQRAWRRIWTRADVRIAGDAFSQRALRVHLFHLFQTASFHNRGLDAGFPARGLHGEAYRGHIFWDELFALPVFDRVAPEISRALLRYRYRRIAPARQAAREAGYAGAMFPWQSGSAGDEQTQRMHLNPRSGTWGPDYSRLQRHVSLAIAYNVWRHWEMTRDRSFLCEMGAELMVSIARFFASAARFDQRTQRFHISGVMGPDEFHEKLPGVRNPGLTDNAYTNIMTVWLLAKARELWEQVPRARRAALARKLSLTDRDFSLWQRLQRRMHVVISAEGIISQFHGYFGLRELNWNAYRARYGDIHRLDRILKAEGDSPDRYKVAKQADVLMLFYLLSEQEVREIIVRLGYASVPGLLRRNYAYYEPRTSHGSTLSKVVHCVLADRMGKRRVSGDLFRDVLRSDLYDIQGGTTPEGIHTGVMGGSLDIVYRCFAGITLEHNVLKVYPHLPGGWRSLGVTMYLRGSWLRMKIRPRSVEILCQGVLRGTLVLDVCGQQVRPAPRRRIRIRYGPVSSRTRKTRS